jgi:hypothetical protein
MTRRSFGESLGRLLDFSGERTPYAQPPDLRYGVNLHIQRVHQHMESALDPERAERARREYYLTEMVRISEEMGLYDLDIEMPDQRAQDSASPADGSASR